jgi:hypothetical protein
MSAAVDISKAAGTAKASEDGQPQESLTPYEAEQVEAIAAWKSMPPHPLGELFKRLTQPGADRIERIIPDTLVMRTLDAAYAIAERAARAMAPADRPLEACDQSAIPIASRARTIAVVEGALTGAGGVLTTLADIPLLFVLSLSTIVKIGRAYGYRLDQQRDRQYVLGVLIAATSGSLEVRRGRLEQLHDIETWFLEETQEEILTEEAASLLFQLELFEEVPAIGAVSGALLNLSFLRRVEVTARRVFQERWLRDRGKVTLIAPRQAHARVHAPGWSGAWGRAAHAGFYGLGFAAALPVCLVLGMVSPRAAANES